MGAEPARSPRSRGVFSVLFLMIAASLMFLSWRTHPFGWTLPLVLVVLATAVSEVFSFEVGGFTVSLAYPLVMCVIVLCGPAASGIAAALTGISFDDIRKRRPPAILAFNVAQLVISSCSGGWVYLVFGGRLLQSPGGALLPFATSDFPRALYGMMGAAVVYAVLNLAMVSFGMAVFRGAKPWAVALGALPLLPAHIALPFVGFLMAQVLALNVLALPLFVFPLLVARQLYQRYVGLSAAYADTIRSLVAALEAKDPYTRGHSERVSEYAAALGRAMGLDSRSLQRLEYAALLHDIGKLTVPAAVLSKPARLSQDEYQRIQRHPAFGAEMVRRIPPLRDLAPAVEQHHERVDGRGYPAGITGETMLLEAKILAVADCYDAMTTTRAYRPALTHEEAIRELELGAGLQFDARVVERFVEAAVSEHPESVGTHRFISVAEGLIEGLVSETAHR